MYLYRIEIKNFRCLKHIEVRDLKEINILIGPNNSGKTAFLEALYHVLGYSGRSTPSEDDFFIDSEDFNPKNSEPIEITIEFRETPENRFSESIQSDFLNIIQYDEDIILEKERNNMDPIRFILLKYEYSYDPSIGKFNEDFCFIRPDGSRITAGNTNLTRNRKSYFPYFIMKTLRDASGEIKKKYSNWGKIKNSIDYTNKQDKIRALIRKINDLLIKDEATLSNLISEIMKIGDYLDFGKKPANIFLQAISDRGWEYLDNLNVFLKSKESFASLPLEKHGMGVQNFALLFILNAYLKIILPIDIENPETAPIVGVEEPEAHLHPQAQRAVYNMLSNMSGQKFISTHSSHFLRESDIHNFLLFKMESGETKIYKIPKYKPTFNFKYGFPDQAYSNNLFFNDFELNKIRRYMLFKNADIFFSNLFILCEGESDKRFLEIIVQKKFGKSLAQLGVSIIPCETNTNYITFLKIASPKAFNLPWLIFSDSEPGTREKVKSQVKEAGYNWERVKENVIFLNNDQDLEKHYVKELGVRQVINTLKNSYLADRYETFRGNQNANMSDKEILYKFLDKSRNKIVASEIIADFMREQNIKPSYRMRQLLGRVKDKLK